MATGPQRARLDRALSGAAAESISRHAREWERCQGILQQIGFALTAASPEVKQKIGGRTGPAVDAAFTRSARSMGAKGAELLEGARALSDAADAITAAKAEQARLQNSPLTQPPAYRPPVGPPTEADIQAESQNRQAHADYAAAYADQESRARQQADAMDRVFGHSTETMKTIHGERDPEPAGSSGGGVGGGSGGGVGGGSGGSVPSGGGGPRPTGGPGHHPGNPGPHPGPGYVPGNPGGSPGGSPGGIPGGPQGGGGYDPVSTPATGGTPGGSVGVPGSTPGGSISAGTGLGLAGAACGGVAGGLLGTGVAAGGIRGGGLTPVVTNPGTAAGGVRGIGTTARTGATGALGRSGGVGAVSSGSGSGSRSGSSSALGRRGTTSGSRGAAGGRGTGSVASGRGGRGKDDEKRRKRDAFDTGDEWVEDEETAPGVLD